MRRQGRKRPVFSGFSPSGLSGTGRTTGALRPYRNAAHIRQPAVAALANVAEFHRVAFAHHGQWGKVACPTFRASVAPVESRARIYPRPEMRTMRKLLLLSILALLTAGAVRLHVESMRQLRWWLVSWLLFVWSSPTTTNAAVLPARHGRSDDADADAGSIGMRLPIRRPVSR